MPTRPSVVICPASLPRSSPHPALERYQPPHAAHAELLRRAAVAASAARENERAIALTANAVEPAELERRLGTLR